MPSPTVLIGGVNLHLSEPDRTEQTWIGQDEVLRQLLACWLVVDPLDRPLAPRLVGPPGIGKTTLAMAAANLRGQPLYINQCTADTRPEDLIITPVLAESGKIAYHASPLVSAMIAGGICLLDEGNRMNEKSWASLAPLLDHRRYVESVLAGIRIHAHAEFRFVTTMNEDASTYELPEYIHSRLMPQIVVDFPLAMDAHGCQIIEDNRQIMIHEGADLAGKFDLHPFGMIHQRIHGAQQMLMSNALGHRWHGHSLQPTQTAQLAVRGAEAVEDHGADQRLGIDLAAPRSQRAAQGTVEAKILPELVQGKDVAIGERSFIGNV